MKYAFAYHRPSRCDGGLVSMAPNLTREPVSFDAELRHPLRFREAISALHDIVISDQRFHKKDKTAYEDWKRSEQQRQRQLAQQATQEAIAQAASRQKIDLSPEFEKQFKSMRSRYWDARLAYQKHLLKHDMALWRLLMPHDPVITVAEDVVMFEAFSADESSYGCLSVSREGGFGVSGSVQMGTTNVDYSWPLYDQFQQLRSYRSSRFQLDPEGFSVQVTSAEHREGKIDLPNGWLRGFMTLQAAMTLPSQRVRLGRESVYSLLAWLKRHKARTSPRALSFDLTNPRSPMMVLEPWGEKLPIFAELNELIPAPIRIWGRQRLMALARLLPLAEYVDVYLLGTGLPSFWVIGLGEMTFTLGLSGWTANDWWKGSTLDQLLPAAAPEPQEIATVVQALRTQRAATAPQLKTIAPRSFQGVMRHLAMTGQAIYDFPQGLFRWRQIMSQAVGEAELGPEHPETIASRQLLLRSDIKITSILPSTGGGTIFAGQLGERQVDISLDADGRIKRAQCGCSYHFKNHLRKGPCRHIIALRSFALQQSHYSIS